MDKNWFAATSDFFADPLIIMECILLLYSFSFYGTKAFVTRHRKVWPGSDNAGKFC